MAPPNFRERPLDSGPPMGPSFFFKGESGLVTIKADAGRFGDPLGESEREFAALKEGFFKGGNDFKPALFLEPPPSGGKGP